MNSERTQAYGRVVRTLEDVGPTKLHATEQERIRDAADTLIFAATLEEAREALEDVDALAEHLVATGRWTEERAAELRAGPPRLRAAGAGRVACAAARPRAASRSAQRLQRPPARRRRAGRRGPTAARRQSRSPSNRRTSAPHSPLDGLGIVAEQRVGEEAEAAARAPGSGRRRTRARQVRRRRGARPPPA